LRSLHTGGGIIAVVLGIPVLLDLQGAVAMLISILVLALLLVGAFEVGLRSLGARSYGYRVPIIAIGIVTVILAGIAIVDTSIGQYILASILALALLLVGFRNPVRAIPGHHPVGAPVA